MSTVGNTYAGSAVGPAKAVILIASALFLVGCATHPIVSMPPNFAPFGRNVTLIYVPGIGGMGQADPAWLKGLRAGGYEGKEQVCDWSGRLGVIEALWADALHRREARHVAERIRKLRSQSPSNPIVVVGQSAGAGVAIMALEDLPPDLQVDNLVLLAPALSRTYDLTAALRHVRRRADVFCSERDTLVLVLGTFPFGTVDGIHGEAAGHGGFIRPPRGNGNAYAKLIAHPYSKDRRLYGDDGGHEGILSQGVAEAVVDPLLPGHESQGGAVAQTGAREFP